METHLKKANSPISSSERGKDTNIVAELFANALGLIDFTPTGNTKIGGLG
jgi:hypothetical protein